MTAASDILSTLTPAEQRAVSLLKAMLDVHNRKDGIGEIATGTARYTVFEGRCGLLSVRSRTVRQWWSLMTRELRLGSTSRALDNRILGLLTEVEAAPDHAVLRVLAEPAAAVMIARALHAEDKETRALLAAGVPDAAPAAPRPVERTAADLEDDLFF